MDSNINSLLVDIYHDFLSKRNKLRIDYDEINSELMIVNEKINLSNIFSDGMFLYGKFHVVLNESRLSILKLNSIFKIWLFFVIL